MPGRLRREFQAPFTTPCPQILQHTVVMSQVSSAWAQFLSQSHHSLAM